LTSPPKNLQPLLVGAVEQLVADLAGAVLLGQLDDLGAVPLRIHSGHETIRKDASDGCARPYVFQLCHYSSLPPDPSQTEVPEISRGNRAGITEHLEARSWTAWLSIIRHLSPPIMLHGGSQPALGLESGAYFSQANN
jgi:hypothetical protein